MWDIINYKDQYANKKGNFKFRVLKSTTQNSKFEVPFWMESKKLYIWSYRVSFGDALSNRVWFICLPENHASAFPMVVNILH